MNKFFTIFKSEYAQVVRKKSFIVGILLTPVLMIVLTMLPAFLATRDVAGQSRYSIIDSDGRGVGQKLADAMDTYRMEGDSTKTAYPLVDLFEVTPGDTAAMNALQARLDSLVLAKDLSRYIVIFPNVEHSDSVMMVSKSLSFRSSSRYDRRISNILTTMRLEKSNVNIGVDSILTMTRRIDMFQKSPGGKTKDFMSTYMGALIFVMIVFVSVISFGQILMRSVIEEKHSRIMEVLMSSISPFQLMMGKIMGLGAANLTQIGTWAVIGLLLFAFRGTVDIPPQVNDIIFNPVIIVFFILFLLIAYVMYSTLFALIGAVCSTEKETQNFIFPITMSLMLPVFLLMYIVQQPDSLASVIMSLIPILTPTMMVARLNIMGPEAFTFTDPIILEATIGVVISGLFSIGLIWLTARIFRMGILMYGKRATLPEIVKWVRYK